MMKIRDFAGAINRCDEVLVPVHYGPGEDDWEWIPISKRDARAITSMAREAKLEEVDATVVEDEEGNNLYINYEDEPEEAPEK